MDRSHDNQSRNSQRALIGAGLAAAAAAGAATFLFARRSADSRRDEERISDAPDHVLRNPSESALVGRTVTINKPRQELYEAWQDFTRFPSFMENVRAVEKVDGDRYRWRIEAPGGASVDLVTRITENRRGELIAWESTPESDVETEGRVEFSEAGPGRGTAVQLSIRYNPPGGFPGRMIAKLLQREPSIQARRDLRRFKQLMETGEVTTNAGPSGRGDSVTESRV